MSYTPAKAHGSESVYFIPNCFSLAVKNRTKFTYMQMRVFTSSVNTYTNPKTVRILKKFLPSVLNTTCFNEDGLTFAQEVKKTEIGHLFEHILLEYLCHYKLLEGFDSAVYNGKTKWNWKKDPWGTFHIVIDSGLNDAHILVKAIDDSIFLLKKILKFDNIETYLPISSSVLKPLDIN